MIGNSWTINSSESVGQIMLRLKAFGFTGNVSARKQPLDYEGFGCASAVNWSVFF